MQWNGTWMEVQSQYNYLLSLQVSLFMSSGSLESYVKHQYEDKVDPAKTDGVTADDVVSPLVKILAPGSFTDNKEQFLAHVSGEKETKFR